MKKKHRIFIAINLPGDIKNYLADFKSKYQDLPAKWTAAENLHITLVFLGDLTDTELGEVCFAAKRVAEKYEPFDINLKEIKYGPDNKIHPRMVWAVGEKSKELSLIKKDLEENLSQKINFTLDLKAFNPHVTMARISAFEWRRIEPEERPEINQNIDLFFTVESVEVMESELKRGRPKYSVVESFPLAA